MFYHNQTEECELYSKSYGNPLKDQRCILETSFQQQKGGSICKTKQNKTV
jgi:hypothetical protein